MASGIDVAVERIVFFGEVARRLPRGGKGKPIHPNTIWRWAAKGLKGPDGEVVRLEYTRVGGRNCTSIEAIQRFFDRLKGKEVVTLLPSTQAKRAKMAEEELRRLGF